VGLFIDSDYFGSRFADPGFAIISARADIPFRTLIERRFNHPDSGQLARFWALRYHPSQRQFECRVADRRVTVGPLV
jgi:hypothetical protein